MPSTPESATMRQRVRRRDCPFRDAQRKIIALAHRCRYAAPPLSAVDSARHREVTRASERAAQPPCREAMRQ
jgi:hypothetical protein